MQHAYHTAPLMNTSQNFHGPSRSSCCHACLDDYPPRGRGSVPQCLRSRGSEDSSADGTHGITSPARSEGFILALECPQCKHGRTMADAPRVEKAGTARTCIV